MYIKSIQLKRFKRFDDLSLDFPSQVTVVKGPNEKGKSTIAQALVAGLFYDSTKSAQYIQEFKSWKGDLLYEIRIRFEVEGEEYLLTKDFEKKEISLVNESTGHLWDTYKEIQEKLREFGGYHSDTLFENTALIRGDQMEILSKEKDVNRALEDSLQNLLAAASPHTSLSGILGKLEKALKEIQRGTGNKAVKNPGTVKMFEDAIARLGGEKKKREEAFSKFDEGTKKLLGLRETALVLKKDLDIAFLEEKKVKAYFDYMRVRERVDVELGKIEQELKTFKAAETRLREFESFSRERRAFETGDLGRLSDLENEIRFNQKEIGQLRNALDRLSQKGVKRDIFLKPSYTVFFAAMFILGFLGFVVSPYFFFSWAFLGGALIILLLFPRRMTSRLEMRTLSASYKKKQERDVELKSKRGEILRSAGVRSRKEFEDVLKRYQEMKEEIGKVKGMQEGILHGRSPEALEEDRTRLLRELGIEEAKIASELKAKPPTSRDVTVLEKNLEEKKRTYTDIEHEITRLEAVLGEMHVAEDEMNKLEEELEMARLHLESEKRKEKVYILLRDKLVEAKQRSVKSVRKALEEKIQAFLFDITEGRYTRVEVDENLGFRVFSSEKNDYVSPEETLSRGTTDQFYLVARFAFLSILFKTKKGSTGPLVILDDPFYSFDSFRRARARELIKSISEHFQIILLTHSDLYDDWGEVRTV